MFFYLSRSVKNILILQMLELPLLYTSLWTRLGNAAIPKFSESDTVLNFNVLFIMKVSGHMDVIFVLDSGEFSICTAL